VGAVPLSAPPPHPHPPPAAPPPPPPPRPPRVAVQRAHTQPTHAHASGTDVDRDNGQGRHGHRAESHSVLSTAGPIIGTLRLTAPVAARLVSCFTIHSPTSLKPTAPSSTGTSPQPSSAVMCCAGGLLRQRQRHRYAGQAHRHTGRQAGRQAGRTHRPELVRAALRPHTHRWWQPLRTQRPKQHTAYRVSVSQPNFAGERHLVTVHQSSHRVPLQSGCWLD
jgi:hypothetical protein